MRISDWSSDVCSSDLDMIVMMRMPLRQGGMMRGCCCAAAAVPEPGQRTRRGRTGGSDRQRGCSEAEAEIGRASWRERGCKYVSISVVAVSVKKNETQMKQRVRVELHTKTSD